MGFGEEQLGHKTGADGGDQRDDQGFHRAEPAVLQQQNNHHIEHRDDAAPDQGDPEEELEGDGGADHLGEVAGRNGQLAEHPQAHAHGFGMPFPAGLGQVAPGGHPQFDAQMLEQDGDQVGDEDHRQERITEPRPAAEVRRPVARVHVPHRDQEARAGEREQLSPGRDAPGDGHGAEDLGKGPGAFGRRGVVPGVWRRGVPRESRHRKPGRSRRARS